MRKDTAMMGWYGNGMSGLGWVGMGLFWLVLIGLIVWLVTRLLPGHPAQTPPNASPPPPATTDVAAPALAVLDHRLASGEIDVETYKTIRATILDSHGGPR